MLVRRESRDASHFLDSISTPKQLRQLESKLDDLCRNPLPNDAGVLKNDGSAYVNVGEFRIIYEVVEAGYLDVLTVGRRDGADVYKRHKRKS